MPAERTKFAKLLKSERFGLLAFEHAHDVLPALAAFAFCKLAGSRSRFAILVIDDDRAIANRPGIARAFQAQVRFSQQASFFLRDLHPPKRRGGRIADSANGGCAFE